MSYRTSSWRTTLSLLVVGGLLGYLAMSQATTLNQRSKRPTDDAARATSNPVTADGLAFEVAELTTSSRTLATQRSQLEAELESLQAALSDVELAATTLDESLLRLEIVLGLRAVHGPGILLNFRESVTATQMLDLLNSLRNVGVEAMRINDRRVIPSTSIGGEVFQLPLEVAVIGNPDLLHEVVVRNGGILHQLDLRADVRTDEDLRIGAAASS